MQASPVSGCPITQLEVISRTGRREKYASESVQGLSLTLARNDVVGSSGSELVMVITCGMRLFHLHLSLLLRLHPCSPDLVSVGKADRQLRINIPNDGQAVHTLFADGKHYNMAIYVLKKAGFQVKVRDDSREEMDSQVSNSTQSLDSGSINAARSFPVGRFSHTSRYLDTQQTMESSGSVHPTTAKSQHHRSPDFPGGTQSDKSIPDGPRIPEEPEDRTDHRPARLCYPDPTIPCANPTKFSAMDQGSLVPVPTNPSKVSDSRQENQRRPRAASSLPHAVQSIDPDPDPDPKAVQPSENVLQSLPSFRILPFLKSAVSRRTKTPIPVKPDSEGREQRTANSATERGNRTHSAEALKMTPPPSGLLNERVTRNRGVGNSEKQMLPTEAGGRARRSSPLGRRAFKPKEKGDYHHAAPVTLSLPGKRKAVQFKGDISSTQSSQTVEALHTATRDISRAGRVQSAGGRSQQERQLAACKKCRARKKGCVKDPGGGPCERCEMKGTKCSIEAFAKVQSHRVGELDAFAKPEKKTASPKAGLRTRTSADQVPRPMPSDQSSTADDDDGKDPSPTDQSPTQPLRKENRRRPAANAVSQPNKRLRVDQSAVQHPTAQSSSGCCPAESSQSRPVVLVDDVLLDDLNKAIWALLDDYKADIARGCDESKCAAYYMGRIDNMRASFHFATVSEISKWM